MEEMRGWRRGSKGGNEPIEFQSWKEPERSVNLGLVPLVAFLLVVL